MTVPILRWRWYAPPPGFRYRLADGALVVWLTVVNNYSLLAKKSEGLSNVFHSTSISRHSTLFEAVYRRLNLLNPKWGYSCPHFAAIKEAVEKKLGAEWSPKPITKEAERST